ncbi:GNAT family N-acetyltransferase [Saccharothrix variisporea]|uniref:Ribosomal protein S18 acetylase RimI-like enzyme n=1 Tax=Saccharothrix variisporea TaxID=543527 RepID=A0A495X241_9PSEU|nr:N-acetyltransferase [Saccharothrix variisporea]RKT68030.1 ribosomal protein S18 acetylase RimI-like enzyme [Saccharothrix variisporea]
MVEIRPATVADVPAVARVWHSGWADGHLGHVPDELVRARTPESFAQRAADLVARTAVAVVDGEVAGFVMVEGDEVEQVYVSADHRGAGVADVLLAEAERRVAAHHDTAWLAVVAGNTRARRFYERHGWTDSGPFVHQAPGGIAVPAHRYVKRLPEAVSRNAGEDQ